MATAKSGDKNIEVSVTANIVIFMILKKILDLNLDSNFYQQRFNFSY